jgi:hypothetical protein
MPSSKHQDKPIPYEEIDVEIRRLVYLLNQLPGIRTVASCAGHEPGAAIVVSLSVKCPCGIHELARRLPFIGVRGVLIHDQPESASILLMMSTISGGLAYELRINGYPDHMRWRTLGQVEKSLLEAFTEGVGSPCPEGGTCRNGGNVLSDHGVRK